MTEQNHDRLGEALRCLRDHTAGKAAPEALEGELLKAFRERNAAPVQRPKRALWASAAIAASLVVAVAWRLSNPAPANVEAPRAIALDAAPAPAPQVTVKPAVIKSRRPKRKAAPAKQYAAAPKPAARQQAFIAIPYAPAFTPYDDAQVVRVNMAGASVRRLGLPATADRVEADLVVGNDGLARAIRLVSNSEPNSYR